MTIKLICCATSLQFIYHGYQNLFSTIPPNFYHHFINSNNLFNEGIKFIILDEVDYMTKLAQQALKTLIQETNINNVKFCLICNYISKIFNGLSDELILKMSRFLS